MCSWGRDRFGDALWRHRVPLLVVRRLAGCDDVVARHSRDTSPSDRCSARGWSQLHRIGEEVADPLVTGYSLQRVKVRSTGGYVNFLYESVNDPSAGAGYTKRRETGSRARNAFTLPAPPRRTFAPRTIAYKGVLHAQDENRPKA